MMYNSIKSRNIILLITLISIFWLSCKKNEEPPIPIGQPIKYNGEVLGNIDSALQKSPYTLFYAAWKKSGLDSAAVNAAYLTIFVPTDSAFTAAGYTASRINSLSKTDADSLVAYHIVYGNYTDSTLKAYQGSTAATTLLTNPSPSMSFPVPSTYGQTFNAQYPYYYSLYISANNGFSINGLAVKNSNKPVNVYRATLYPINKVIPRPDKDVLATLKSDPQFSFLMESFRLSDSIYAATFNHNPNYDNDADIEQFPLNTYNANMTYFAPSNTAFKNFLAGVYNKQASEITLSDLNNFQNRVVIGYYDNESSPVDSLIDVYIVKYGYRNYQPYVEPINRPLVTGATWLYNDLLYNGPALSGLQDAGNGANINLDFIHTGNQVQVKRHDTNSLPPVNVAPNSDIITTNGVIHVVDGFLKP